MNLYKFHNTVVLRHPVYSFQQFSEQNLATILQDHFFRNAIYLCSPTVFDELKKNDFEYAKLNAKLKNTLLKYFNRMCYRPTPFALCAAVSAVNWSESNDAILFDEVALHPLVKLSYAKSLQVAAKIVGAAEAQSRVMANATLYKTGKQIRYIKSLTDDTDKISFCIASSDISSLLNKILNFAASPRAIDEVKAFVIKKVDCTGPEAADYLQSLLNEQILVDLSAFNITGVDYLDKLMESIGKYCLAFDNSVYNDLNNIINVSTLNEYLRLNRTRLQKNDLYINLVSKLENGCINSAYQNAILDGLNGLTHVNQPHMPKGISQFVQQFNKKFEEQTIPLLLALDPEAGVGYGELTSYSESLNFADDIGWKQAQADSDSVNWGQLQRLILSKWTTGGKYEPIKLYNSDLKHFYKSKPTKLPSALSVMFRPAGAKVLIEQVAGVTATSLIGRFTPVNAMIDKLAQDIALHEADSNPDIIYAEIVHTCHKQTANIDRRNHIYPYEIVILTPSTLDEHFQILLSDLYVSVQNHEPILWSARLKKRVVPRLSSAFNYQRDDLAAFRFLCDLQHIGVQTNFNFTIENFFPGLDYYPRVEFEQAILHCAQWHLDAETFASVLTEKDKLKLTDAFKHLRQRLQFSKYVALTQHDNQLLFDLDQPADVDFFLETIRPLKKTVIREVLTDTINSPLLYNNNNEGIVSQFIATLYHKERVYQPKVLNLPVAKRQSTRKFTPGTEWLYLKLYCHSGRANEIIGNVLFKVAKKALKAELITQWFFTRYNDPDQHIRFRLKVQSGKYENVIEEFNQAVALYQKQGLLSSIIIDTYNRELERYPDIDAVENIFYYSSVWVGYYLNSTWQQLKQEDSLAFAFSTTRKLLDAVRFSNDEKITYLTNVVDSFMNEFSHIPNLKYQLDLTYRKHKLFLSSLKDAPALNANSKLKKIGEENCRHLAAYIKQLGALPVSTIYKHLADVIHMHLNRIFNDQPREQEFTLYYLLLKYEKAGKYFSQTV